MKHSLAPKGLSMTQAQSISNLCNQRANFINSQISNVNNVTKTFKQNGEEFTYQIGKNIPNNILELLTEKSSLHALQAFLMENIKYKESLLTFIKNDVPIFPKSPIKPVIEQPILEKTVDEKYGWEQLTKNEYNEYLISEAYASHIGQYIHQNGTLDNLRKSYDKDCQFQFIELLSGVKTPLQIVPNHSEETLMNLHQKLEREHRQYEQKVNYYKAKVKNLVSDENAKIAQRNADLISEYNNKQQVIMQEYNTLVSEWSNEVKRLSQVFEQDRMKLIKETSALRIEIPSSLQNVVDGFLKDIKEV